MKAKFIYFSVFLILLSSCGTSLIKVTGNSRPYSVFIDNQYKGMTNDKIKIQRSGMPQKKTIEIWKYKIKTGAERGKQWSKIEETAY